MSNHLEVIQRLESYFSDNWTDQYPCQSDSNKWFNLPDFSQPTNSIWCSFSVRHGASEYKHNCGGDIANRRTGLITLYVYTPKDKAINMAYTVAPYFIDVFENITIESNSNCEPAIYTEQASIIPSADRSNFAATRIVIPFYFED